MTPQNQNNSVPIDIKELRLKLDQINEQIIIGLKYRSRFPINSKTFTEEFAEGKSWFLYRLKKEQDIDSEFGRFLNNDQVPLVYSKRELAPSLVKRLLGIKPPEKKDGINISTKIIDNYKEVLLHICEHAEDKTSYDETTKLDVENVLLYNERIIVLGEQVALYKIQQNPKILQIASPEELKRQLVSTDREKEVIKKTIKTAEKYGLHKIKAIKKFTQKIIDITTDVEIKRILLEQKK